MATHDRSPELLTILVTPILRQELSLISSTYSGVGWPEALGTLPDEPDRVYRVPASRPVTWTYPGIPVDLVEDLLPRSAAHQRAARILFSPPNRIYGRPLTPLHGGHTAIVAVSGCWTAFSVPAPTAMWRPGIKRR